MKLDCWHKMTDDHDHRGDCAEAASIEAFLGLGLIELLIGKDVFSRQELMDTIAEVEGTTHAIGARIVARAWIDAAFRNWILEPGQANKAILSLGIDATYPMFVVANTPDEHNLVVCTLCSCYPRSLLGPPPSWYRSSEYRARAVAEPRAVLAEFGLVLGDYVRIRVHDSTADLRYLVIPQRPEGTDGMDEAQLASLVTRDSMVGAQTISTA